MTILHVSDLHFDKRWFDWLSDSAPHHDLLVISGDILDHAHPVYPTKQMHWVSAWVRDLPSPVCLCSGNHDLVWDDRDARWLPATWMQDLASDRVQVDGQRRTFGDTRIAAVGAVDRSRPEADVWVVHSPPVGVDIARNQQGQDQGDRGSSVWGAPIAPTWVLAGHVHRPLRWHDSRRGIHFVNPGQNRQGRFPNYVLIDLARGSLIHVTDSVTGPRCFAAQVKVPPLHAAGGRASDRVLAGVGEG